MNQVECDDDGIERITAAAILTKQGVFSLPPPARHHTLIQAAASNNNPTIKGQSGQGFVTNKGRFVDRIVAATIAISAGQITELQWPPRLYSEDLW